MGKDIPRAAFAATRGGVSGIPNSWGKGREKRRPEDGKKQGDREPSLRQSEWLERAQGLAALCPLRRVETEAYSAADETSVRQKKELTKVCGRAETLRFTR